MPAEFDTIIVGGGVVGLAIARTLAGQGRSVLILEQASAIGTATSSRNSGVLHAGLYYPPGSLRARLCAPGRRALYDFCARHAVPHRQCGKLVVAAEPAEEDGLHALHERAVANGVEDLSILTGAQARGLEPDLRCAAAMLSPRTGIVDVHALMFALLAEAEAAGAILARRTAFAGASPLSPGWRVRTADISVTAAHLVIAAGHGAPAAAARVEGLQPAHIPAAYLSKGSYFALTGRSPFRHLIYPMPIPGGAGIHLTLDLDGAARFGPDVEPAQSFDYAVDPARGVIFYDAIRRYWPGLPDGALQPAYAGFRPKIVPAAESQDFMISGPGTHALPGLVTLFGIESPGLTSCLAIGEFVAELIA